MDIHSVETRTIKLSQSAIDKAVKAHRSGQAHMSVSINCPIFHALTEAGFNLQCCGLSDAWVENAEEIAAKKDRIILDLNARRITSLPARDWENVNPMEFTITLQK